MKKLIYSFICAVAGLGAASCQQVDIATYNGDDAIFFDQQYGVAWFDTLRQAHQIYSFIPFGSMATTDSLLKVKIETTGYIRDYDRPFSVEVVNDSTTAEAGVEYEILNPDLKIAAGQNSTVLNVLMHCSGRMDTTTVQLQVRLVPGEHFTLPFGKEFGKMPKRDATQTVYKQFSTNTDPSIHNIFANKRLSRPKGWSDFRFGTFSEKKYALLLKISGEVMGWTVLDFENDENNKMTISRSPIVVKHVSAYLKAEYNKGREFWVLDEDGSMMWVNGCPWAAGTRPEDLVAN